MKSAIYHGFKPETRERLFVRGGIRAITHLRAQLAERDPLGAVVMRERAAKACEAIEEVLRQGYAVTSANAVCEAYCAIRALPLPTQAEEIERLREERNHWIDVARKQATMIAAHMKEPKP